MSPELTAANNEQSPCFLDFSEFSTVHQQFSSLHISIEWQKVLHNNCSNNCHHKTLKIIKREIK